MTLNTALLEIRLWLQRSLKIPGDVVDHAIASLSILGVGLLLHYILHHSGDPKMFDTLPWTYVTDAGDLAVFVASTWNIVKAVANGGNHEK